MICVKKHPVNMILWYISFIIITCLFIPFSQAGELVKSLPSRPEQMQLSFAPLVKKAAPAVVNIYTRRTVQKRVVSPFLNDPFYSQLLESGLYRERVENSLGSGVIVKANGLIVTNHHVIKGSDEITIVLADKREFQAQLLIADKKTDLALLSIESNGEILPYLPLSDSDMLEVGDLVLAIGNPFGIGQTVTSGIVSDPARTSVGIGDYPFFIQTDAAINPGNSGGALVNMRGELVGVNTAIFSNTGTSNGIGFAIPSNMVKTIVDSSSNNQKKNHIVRPWIGAVTQSVTAEIANILKLKIPRGVLVSSLYPKGPAEKAGFKQGDVILQLDNHDISDEPSLRFHIATYPIGKIAQVKLLRDGHEIITPLAMQPPLEIPTRDAHKITGNHPLAGAEVVNLSPAVADELDLTKINGVVVWEVDKESLAERIGLERGDVIEALNSTAVTSTAQLIELMQEKVLLWELIIRRGNDAVRLLVKK